MTATKRISGRSSGNEFAIFSKKWSKLNAVWFIQKCILKVIGMKNVFLKKPLHQILTTLATISGKERPLWKNQYHSPKRTPNWWCEVWTTSGSRWKGKATKLAQAAKESHLLSTRNSQPAVKKKSHCSVLLMISPTSNIPRKFITIS